MSNSDLLGHDYQRESLQRLWRGDKLPSTMMFAGASGVGKLMVAKELCRTLVCDSAIPKEKAEDQSYYGGCGECKGCHIFDVGNFPDYYLVQCADKETWNVASVRELLFSLNLNPFSHKSRLVIFDNAEHLSIQAANILLKSLEEPRPNTYFFLITSNPSRLPRTVISRAQVWFFDSLTKDQIRTLLKRDSKYETSLYSDKELEVLATLADGSLENIDSIIKYHDEWLNLKESLDLIFEGSVAEAGKLATLLGKDKEALRPKLHLLRVAARERMHEFSGSESLARWAVFITNLLAAERLIFERNVSANAVLFNSFLELVATPHLRSFTRFTNSAILLDRINF